MRLIRNPAGTTPDPARHHPVVSDDAIDRLAIRLASMTPAPAKESNAGPITIDITRDGDGQIKELFILSDSKSLVATVERGSHGEMTGLVIEPANVRRSKNK